MAFCCVKRAEFVTRETLDHEAHPYENGGPCDFPRHAGPLLADELPVRNCTWCHGTSAQGYSEAPRLAGQRVDYVVNQLQSFATHKRDEFLSIKYMWNATAQSRPGRPRVIWPHIFLRFRPRPRRTATANSSPRAGLYLKTAFPTRTLSLARRATAPKRRASARFRASAGSLTTISSVGSSSGARARTLGGRLCRKSRGLCRRIKSPPSRRF